VRRVAEAEITLPFWARAGRGPEEDWKTLGQRRNESDSAKWTALIRFEHYYGVQNKYFTFETEHTDSLIRAAD
jgi:hypothetical protein